MAAKLRRAYEEGWPYPSEGLLGSVADELAMEAILVGAEAQDELRMEVLSPSRRAQLNDESETLREVSFNDRDFELLFQPRKDGVLEDSGLERPHSTVDRLEVPTPSGSVAVTDFSRLHTRFPFIAFMPQWDFLDFVTGEAGRHPSFHLLMNAEARELIEEEGVVRGLRYEATDGWHDIRADLVVAADGRSSVIRERAGLVPIETSPPVDVLWFRLSRRPDDPDSIFGRAGAGQFLIFLNRNDYWQVGSGIAKGGADQVRAAGLDAFRRSLARVAPEFGDRVAELTDWDQIKLLVVQANRLKQWWRPGLLCIGDAAHAMSPVAGVGINLAIQDAVVAANVLADPLREGCLTPDHLAAVQRRRQWPTRIIQLFQALTMRATTGLLRRQDIPTAPKALQVVGRIPLLRTLPARLIGFGLWPVHVRE